MSSVSKYVELLRGRVHLDEHSEALLQEISKSVSALEHVRDTAEQTLISIDNIGLCDECFPRFPLPMMTSLHRSIDNTKKIKPDSEEK